jgi:hypothetical protein
MFIYHYYTGYSNFRPVIRYGNAVTDGCLPCIQRTLNQPVVIPGGFLIPAAAKFCFNEVKGECSRSDTKGYSFGPSGL